MPAGLAKVLEILNNSLNMSDPEGELAVNGSVFEVEKASDTVDLVATYLAANGLYAPELITLTGGNNDEGKIMDKKSKVFTLTPGTYTVKAGGYSQEVKVTTKENK